MRRAILLACLAILASPRISRAEADAGPVADSGLDAATLSDAGSGPVRLPELPPELRPEVRTEASPAEVDVGQEVTLAITVTRNAGDSVLVPSNTSFAPWEILKRDATQKKLENGRVEETFTIRLLAFEPGDLPIPAVDLHVRTAQGRIGSVQTSAVPIRVTSVLGNAPADAGPRDLHGPVDVLHKDYTLLYVLGGIAAIALVAGLTLLLRRLLAGRHKKPAVPAAPPRPAEEVAIALLDALKRDDLPARGRMMEHYMRLADIARVYLGSRYRFEALERTTAEVMQSLRDRGLDGSSRNLVRSILDECDLVKFAKYAPTVRDASDLLEAAYRLVRETTPPACTPVETRAAGKDKPDAGLA